jgi:serine/threonine-protein kinase
MRPAAEPAVRAVPFINRPASEEPGRFPWKLAAAAVLVMAVGVMAGRTYLQGPEEKAPPASAPSGPVAAAGIPPAAARTGGLAIETQPTGAKVSIDGTDAGVTPLQLQDLAPGRHTVVVTTDNATVRRTVRVEAGRIVTLDIPVYSGWVVVFSPIPLDIAAGGATLGNTDTGRIILPPGRHVLTLTNREYGYSETRAVVIIPGEERPLNVEPKGTVNVNAHPWAEVWIDGKKAGDTPIANLPVLLGTRVFLFKHPQYGERRVTTTITSKPAALTVDLTKS